jgi:hypothetical protein
LNHTDGLVETLWLQAGRRQIRFPMRSLDFFNLSDSSSGTMVLGLTASNRNEHQEP